MKIAVVGTGYVGLVTGTCFAEIGVDVVCVDIDAEKIARIKRGDIPIYEPGLDEMVLRNMKAGRLRFATDLSTCLDGVEILSAPWVLLPMRTVRPTSTMCSMWLTTWGAA